MNLILLGPPGAGKGTMASGIKERYSIPHISTGDIFRTAIKNQTEIGKQVQAIIAEGSLVPDELTVALVEERIQQDDAKDGFILDGFPRTIPQAEAFERISKIDTVLDFAIPHEKVIKRLTGRRICRTCGEIYHVETKQPKVEGICDLDGGELYIRPDDMEDSIRHRLEVYDAQTAPLIAFYKEKGLMKVVDAEKGIEETLNSIFELLG